METRPLDHVYMIVYIDAIMVNPRGTSTVSTPAHPATARLITSGSFVASGTTAMRPSNASSFPALFLLAHADAIPLDDDELVLFAAGPRDLPSRLAECDASVRKVSPIPTLNCTDQPTSRRRSERSAVYRTRSPRGAGPAWIS